MARINLSIPDELKKRMDNARFNWSEVARQAFEDKLKDRDWLIVSSSKKMTSEV